MPIPDSIRNAKNLLSETLLRQERFPGIHGVGTGKSGDKFRVRIYVTDPAAPDLPQILMSALKLPAVPTMPVFMFANPFGDTEVEVIGAPQAHLVS